jgi:hypothetical protein
LFLVDFNKANILWYPNKNPQCRLFNKIKIIHFCKKIIIIIIIVNKIKMQYPIFKKLLPKIIKVALIKI